MTQIPFKAVAVDLDGTFFDRKKRLLIMRYLQKFYENCKLIKYRLSVQQVTN